MKRLAIVLNLLAAAAFFVLAVGFVGMHAGITLSEYCDWKKDGVINVDKFNTQTPPLTDEDMPVIMRQAGNIENNLMTLAELAATACLLNAAAIYFLTKKRDDRTPTPSPS
jgi:hypothetical protein